MQREHFADGLVDGGAEPAEPHALVIGVVTQFALSVIEERSAAVRAHDPRVDRELEIAGADGRAAVCLPAARTVAYGVGAQHSGRRNAALFRDLPESARTRVAVSRNGHRFPSHGFSRIISRITSRTSSRGISRRFA